MTRIVLVDPQESRRDRHLALLQAAGHGVRAVRNLEEARALLEAWGFALVISVLELEDGCALDLLSWRPARAAAKRRPIPRTEDQACAEGPDKSPEPEPERSAPLGSSYHWPVQSEFASPCALIVLSDAQDEREGIRCIKAGAQDYVRLKPQSAGGSGSGGAQTLADGLEFLPLVSSNLVDLEGHLDQQGELVTRAKLAEQLRQTQKLDSIGRLAGGFAHEFNNILQTVLGYGALCFNAADEGSQLQADLRHVLGGAQRAKELVAQVLTFSRQAGRHRDRVHFASLLNETLRVVSAQLPGSIELVERIDDSLQIAGAGDVLCDVGQIQRVIFNLAHNAQKAMTPSGGRCEVNLSLAELSASVLNGDAHAAPVGLAAGRYVLLSIQDNGCGMDRQTLERAVEPFFQLPGPSSSFSAAGVGAGPGTSLGTGLGLSVAHGIITSHGGELTIESGLGQGTQVRVYLPVAEEESAEADAFDSRANGRGHVLYVDDDEEVAYLGQRMLEGLGYQVTVLTGGPEALKLVSSDPQRFDVLITDQVMPELTGLELAREVNRIRPGLPIVLLTGSGLTEAEALAAGTASGRGRVDVREFLMKPVAPRELGAALQRVMG